MLKRNATVLLSALLLGLLAGCEPGVLEESGEEQDLGGQREASSWGKKPPVADEDLQPLSPPATIFPGGQAGVSPQQGGQTCGAVAVVNAMRFATGDPSKLDEATVAGWDVWTWLPGGIQRWGSSTEAVGRALQHAADEQGGLEVERVSLSGVDHPDRWDRIKREVQAGHPVAVVLRWGPKNAHWLVLHQVHAENGREFVAHAQAGSLGWIERDHLLQELHYNLRGPVVGRRRSRGRGAPRAVAQPRRRGAGRLALARQGGVQCGSSPGRGPAQERA